MKLQFKLGLVSAALVVAIGANPIALAQVDWTYNDLAIPAGPPGTGQMVQGVVFDGTTYHLYLVSGNSTVPWLSSWWVDHWTSASLAGPWDEDPSNPVLEPEPGQWDGYTILSASVLYDADTSTFRMWYGATDSYFNQVTVGYAQSADGSAWTKHASNPLDGLEPGPLGTWNDWVISPGTVIKNGASYDMWFAAWEYNDGAIDLWRIGHATSSDGLLWSQTPNPVLEATQTWEGVNVYNAEVMRIGDGYGMWYAGATSSPALAYVGYAVSPDGIHWGKCPDAYEDWQGFEWRNPVISPQAGCNRFDSFAVTQVGDTFHGWGTNCFEVHHLTSPFEVLLFDAFETGDVSIWSSTVP